MRMFFTGVLLETLGEWRSEEERDELAKVYEQRLEDAIAKEPEQFHLKVITNFVVVRKVK